MHSFPDLNFWVPLHTSAGCTLGPAQLGRSQGTATAAISHGLGLTEPTDPSSQLTEVSRAFFSGHCIVLQILFKITCISDSI